MNDLYSEYVLFTPSSKELDLVNEEAVDNYILSNKIDRYGKYYWV